MFGFRVETELLENVQLTERETLHRMEIHTLKVIKPRFSSVLLLFVLVSYTLVTNNIIVFIIFCLIFLWNRSALNRAYCIFLSFSLCFSVFLASSRGRWRESSWTNRKQKRRLLMPETPCRRYRHWQAVSNLKIMFPESFSMVYLLIQSQSLYLYLTQGYNICFLLNVTHCMFQELLSY